MFVLLIHPDEAVRLACLVTLQQAWAKLQQAERMAARSIFWKLWVPDMYWPLSTWHREVFIFLEEVEFKAVPLLVRNAVEGRLTVMCSEMTE